MWLFVTRKKHIGVFQQLTKTIELIINTIDNSTTAVTNNLLPNHVTQSVVLFVHGEYRSVRDFCIYFFDDSKKKKVNHKNIYAFLFVRHKQTTSTNRTEITHFFSPSYNKNDSNVGGAFILKPRTIPCFLQLLLTLQVLTSTTLRHA